MAVINLFHCFSEKIRLDVSSESSAWQRIHMKNQALFSLKDRSKRLKCHLLQVLLGALRVSVVYIDMSRIFIFYLVLIHLQRPKFSISS